MSKKRAKRELGPFSSTSSHQGFADSAIPMWFGTRSMTCFFPCRVIQCLDPRPVLVVVPMSGLKRVGSATSYPCGLPGTAFKYDEA